MDVKFVTELIRQAEGVEAFMKLFVEIHRELKEDSIIPVESFIEKMEAGAVKGEVIEELRVDYFNFTSDMLKKYAKYMTSQVVSETVVENLNDLIPPAVLHEISKRL